MMALAAAVLFLGFVAIVIWVFWTVVFGFDGMKNAIEKPRLAMNLTVREVSSEGRGFGEIIQTVRSNTVEDLLYAKKVLKPLVSVIIPYFNAHTWLRETLNSLEKQTLADFEVILVEDASTDNSSLAAVEALVASFPEVKARGDSYRVLYHSINQGLSGARNTGVRYARGDFVIFLDPDDQLQPTGLEKLALMAVEVTKRKGKLAMSQRTAFVYPGVEHFGDKVDIVFADYSKKRLTKENFITSCALIDRKSYIESGGMCESIKYFEDYDFWLRMASRNMAGKLLREPLFRYRRHPQGRSTQIYSRASKAEYMDELRANNPVAFGDLPANHDLTKELPCYRPFELSGDLGRRQEIRDLAQRIGDSERGLLEGDRAPLLLTLADLISEADSPRLIPFPNARPRRHGRALSVLYIIPWMVMGGADLYDLHILGALRKMGARVTLVTCIETTHSWESHFASRTQEIFYLPRISNDTARVDAILDHLVLSRSIDVVFTRNNDPGYRAVERWKATQGLRGLRAVDILHLENKAFERQKEAPQPGWEEKSQPLHDYLDRRIVASENLQQHIIETQGLPPASFMALYPAVDSQLYDPVKMWRASWPPGVTVLLKNEAQREEIQLVTFVGRFEEQKDPITWVKVATEIARENEKAAFLMIGGGWMRARAESMVREAGLVSRFHFTGQLEHPEVLKYLALSDVLLLTSIYEGVPIVILEAICLGVPTVSTNFGGIKDLLEGGAFGQVVATSGKSERELISALKDQVLQVFAQGRLDLGEKKAWHQRCSAKYDLGIFQERIIEMVQELISGSQEQEREETFKERLLYEFIRERSSFVQ